MRHCNGVKAKSKNRNGMSDRERLQRAIIIAAAATNNSNLFPFKVTCAVIVLLKNRDSFDFSFHLAKIFCHLQERNKLPQYYGICIHMGVSKSNGNFFNKTIVCAMSET